MLDLPRPGLEPVSPALAGGFLTTVPPGKPYVSLLTQCINSSLAIISAVAIIINELGEDGVVV